MGLLYYFVIYYTALQYTHNTLYPAAMAMGEIARALDISMLGIVHLSN